MSNISIKNEMLAIDTKDRGWWNRLTDEERKKVGPWILMRYTSACKNNNRQFEEHYLEWTNELVNVHFNSLSHHPQLQIQLMQAIGLGISMYHPWIAPGKKGTSNKLHQTFQKIYRHLNDDELDIMINMHDKDELTELLEQHGIDKKEIKKLLK
jgi:hypothetical protein